MISTLSAHWRNVSRPPSSEAHVVGRLTKTLKSGKAVWEKSLTGELVEKGEKEMAKNLKDGKAVEA